MVKDNLKNLIGTRIDSQEIRKIQDALNDYRYIKQLVRDKGIQVGDDEIKYEVDVSYDMDVSTNPYL